MATASLAVVAAALAAAGLLKIVHRRQFAEVLEEFGVAPARTPLLSLAVPVAELTIATALVVPAIQRPAAIAAIALLGLFTAALVRSLLAGRRPECNCFGPLSRGEIGWGSVARNAVLMILGAVGAASGDAEGDAALIAAIVWAATASLLAVDLWRDDRDLRDRVRGLERAAIIDTTQRPAPSRGLTPGTMAPAFTMAALDGGAPITLSGSLARGVPVMLIFTDAVCPACQTLMRLIPTWQAELEDQLSVVLAASGDPDVLAHETARFGIAAVGHDPDLEVAEAFKSDKTPAAVLIAPGGTMMSDLARGRDEIELVIEILTERANHAAPM